MSLPVLTRSWQFQVNQLVRAAGSTALNCVALMYATKQSFIGAGAWTDSTGAAVASAGNWVVRSSCNGQGGVGSFGNNDNVDRWLVQGNGATTGDLRWAAAASNHSWIVLEQAGVPGAVGNLQACLDLSNATQDNATIVMSPSAGFLAGTATARPTAADEQVLINNAAWGGVSGDNNTALHVLKSADGKSTRVIAVRSSSNASGAWCVMFWLFELPVANAAWTNPAVGLALAANSANPTSGRAIVANLSSAANTWGRTPGGTNFASVWSAPATQQHGLVTDSYGSINGGQQCVSDVDGEAPLLGVGLYSTTVNARGRNGRIVDIRYGLENVGTGFAAANGRSYPVAIPYRQQMQFDDVVNPWNRSLPLVLT